MLSFLISVFFLVGFSSTFKWKMSPTICGRILASKNLGCSSHIQPTKCYINPKIDQRKEISTNNKLWLSLEKECFQIRFWRWLVLRTLSQHPCDSKTVTTGPVVTPNTINGGFHKWGYPHLWMVFFFGKIHQPKNQWMINYRGIPIPVPKINGWLTIGVSQSQKSMDD